MIPLNVSAVFGSDAGSLVTSLQSDENIVGNASPVEVLTFCGAILVAYIAGLFAAYYLKRRFSHKIRRDHLDFWIRFLRVLLILAAVAVTVPQLFDAGSVVIAGIVIGLIAIFAFAGQKVVTNLVAGLSLMYGRQFSAGDFVTIGNVTGTVISLDLFTTCIRTTEGVTVTLPNDSVYNNPISNYHADVARRYVYDVGIRYRDDIPRAIAIITGILDRHTFVLKSPAPEVFVSDLGPSSVNIRIRAWVPSVWANTRDDSVLKTALLPQVKCALAEAGIGIPFPQTTVWFGDKTVDPESSGTR